MLFTLLASSAFAGCGNIMRAQPLTQCTGGGYRVGMAERVRTGDWRSRSCAEQCEEWLGGRPGCCMQKTNKAHCWAYLGTRKEGIYVQKGISPTQATSCNAPAYTGSEFTQTVRESNTCPGGFEPITSAAECQRANNELIAGVYHPVGSTHRGWSTRPGGCFLQVTGYPRLNGYVMFNNNPVGGTAETRYNSNDMKICVRSTPITGPPACPLPTVADTTSRGCAPAGYTGNEGANCLNGNAQYVTFLDAWNACDAEPECDLVQRWTHWSWFGYRYFLRRSGDRVTDDGEGFTYSCAHACPADISATGSGEWAMGEKGETCDHVCSLRGKTCDAAKMTCIDSAAKIQAAFLEAGHVCQQMPDARNYAGAPFFQASGACYWFGRAGAERNVPGPQHSVCNANDKAWHTALCYCQ